MCILRASQSNQKSVCFSVWSFFFFFFNFYGPLSERASRRAFILRGKTRKVVSWHWLELWLYFFYLNGKSIQALPTLITVRDGARIAVVQNGLLLFTSCLLKNLQGVRILHLDKRKHQMGCWVWAGDVWKEAYEGFNWGQRPTTTH